MNPDMRKPPLWGELVAFELFGLDDAERFESIHTTESAQAPFFAAGEIPAAIWRERAL